MCIYFVVLIMKVLKLLPLTSQIVQLLRHWDGVLSAVDSELPIDHEDVRLIESRDS